RALRARVRQGAGPRLPPGDRRRPGADHGRRRRDPAGPRADRGPGQVMTTRPDRRPASTAGAAARARRERRELLRPTRRRALVRRWMVLFVFLGVLGLLYLVFFTGVLG